MKTALITGANKGLGFETAKLMLQHGFYVHLGCRDQHLGAAAVQALKAQGLHTCELLVIDTSDQTSVTEAAATFKAKAGELHVLINNAAILGRVPDTQNPLTVADVKTVFETNLFGTIRVTEAFMPFLKNTPQPRIVNVTSTLASLTLHQDPEWPLYFAKSITYGPSKTALNAYTVALAYEHRDSPIKINCVTPGYTKTDLNGHSGGKSPAENCKIIVKYALLDNNGPTGKYFGEQGELPW